MKTNVEILQSIVGKTIACVFPSDSGRDAFVIAFEDDSCIEVTSDSDGDRTPSYPVVDYTPGPYECDD